MRKRTKWTLLIAVGILTVGVAWAVRFATSEAAVAYVAHKLVAAAKGRLAIEGAGGSLFGTVRIAAIRYNDDSTRVAARDVTLEVSLRAITSLSVALRRLAIAELEVAPHPSTGKSAPPESLGLPLDLAIDSAAIDRLVVLVDGGPFEARRLSFGYHGTPSGHVLRALETETPTGILRADMTLGAAPPFPVNGALAITLDAPPLSGDARVTIAGNTNRLDLTLDGTLTGAKIAGTAEVAPFAINWLPRAALQAAGVDVARIDDALPHTQLAIEARATGGDDGSIGGALSLRNSQPGPLTAGRAPLVALDSRFALKYRVLVLSELVANLGAAGRAYGNAALAADRVTLGLTVQRLDLRSVHGAVRETQLDGTIEANIHADAQSIRAQLAQRGLRFELEGTRAGDQFVVREFTAESGASRLAGNGLVTLTGKHRFEARGALERFDPAAFGDFPRARINATIAATGELAPTWHADAEFKLAPSRWRSVALGGGGRFAVRPDELRDADVKLQIGANVIDVRGALGRPDDTLHVFLNAVRLTEIDPRAAGQATLDGTLRGAIRQPRLDFALKAERLRLLDLYEVATLEARGGLSPEQDPRIDIDMRGTALKTPRIDLAAASAKVSGSMARHLIELHAAGTDIDLAVQLVGKWHAHTWTGTVESLINKGRFPIQLSAPATLELARDRLSIGAATGSFGDGKFALRRLRWADARLTSEGEFSSIQVAPFLALFDLSAHVSSTLALRGAWSIDATPHLNGTVAFARESGDIVVGQSPRVPLDLEALEINARLVDDAVTGTLNGKSGRVGTATARFAIGRAPDAEPGTISPRAPLEFTAALDIASLRPLTTLSSANAVADGRLTATLTGSGTLNAPRVTGRIEASALALEVPEYGIRLINGRLVATLQPDAVRLEAFEIQGGEGRLTAQGVAMRAGASDTKIAWRAENLRLLGLPDLRVTVDGEGTLARAADQVALEGLLRVREGYVAFARQATDKLSDDVEVIGRPRRRDAKPPRELPLKLALDVELGKNFHVVSAGLDTNLTGRLRVVSRDNGTLFGKGAIDVVHGLYFFLGQRLEIERGRLIFDGPVENPALDVRAVRKGLPVEPGVELAGTVRMPRVTLTSSPPLPDGEKLAWLVLGRSLDTASAADAVLLQGAAASLLDDSQSIPLGRRVALAMGLDDISLKGGSQMQSQVVAIGKRLSDRLYVTFEQSLAVAQTAVSLEYLLGRGFRVRASGGHDNNVGVFFTRSWD